MVGACAVVLANLCAPQAYAAVVEQVGVGAKRRVNPAALQRLGVRVQVIARPVTASAPLSKLQRACVRRTCVAYRATCETNGLSCSFQEWPLERKAWRSPRSTWVPLQEIRIISASVRAREAAERALKLQAGSVVIPLARLAARSGGRAP